MSRLRDARVVLGVVLLVTWLVAGGFFYMNKKNTDAKLHEKEMQVGELQETITQIGELVPAYALRADVPGGKAIKEEDLEIIDVPVGMSHNVISDIDEIKGKYYKLRLSKGSILTSESVYEEELTDDLRLFDVVTHTNPIGLKPGSYVDIRIQMPMGEDYIAIAHRKVLEVNTGVLKVAVNEQDIHAYNSMLVDTIMYPGSQIYAVEYLEGGIQKPAETYYPVSKNVVAIAQKDPNLLSAIKEDMVQRRTLLETGLNAAGVGLTEKEREQEALTKTIERRKQELVTSISESQKEVDKARAEFEAEQARQAERDAQNAQ